MADGADDTGRAERPDGADESRPDQPPLSIYDVIRPPTRQRSIRQLPSLLLRALRLVWEPSPKQAVVAGLWQLASAALLLVQLVVARSLLARILERDASAIAIGDVSGHLALLALATTLAAVAAAVGPERQRILGELVRRHAMGKIIDVTSRVDLEAFETPRFHDALLRARINSQVRPLQLATGLLTLVQAAVTSLAIVVALGAIEPLLLPLIVVGYLPLLWASNRNSRMVHHVESELTAGDRERAYLEEILTGKDAAKEVRAFSLPAFLQRRYDLLWDNRLDRHRKLARARIWRLLPSTIIATAAMIGALAILLWGVTTGRTPLATAATAAVALQLVGGRLRGVNASISTLYECSLFLEDVAAFLDLAPVADQQGSGTGTPGPLERVSFDDVSFRYPGTTAPVLQHVSLQLDAGEIVALVGENGSGKTTLAKLLCGLYTPTEGSVRWNGDDLRSLDLDTVRRQIGVIFQDFLQYQLPARSNIGVGRHEAIDDHDAIVEAAKLAGAHHFLSALHDGYDTLLSRAFLGGVDLSIGQWQRVALARAFFRNAPLLILDEPTAALDPRAEHDLFASMRELAQGRTVLLISHRFSSVRSADRILVLDRGRLVEEGSHEELMAAPGLYADLFNLQAKAYVDRP